MTKLEEKKLCPDGGTCHHDCGDECFRVQCCGPLSGVYPDDRWPLDVREQYAPGQNQKEADDLIAKMDKISIELRQDYGYGVVFAITAADRDGCNESMGTVKPEHADDMIEMLEAKITWLRRIKEPCPECGLVESAGHKSGCSRIEEPE